MKLRNTIKGYKQTFYKSTTEYSVREPLYYDSRDYLINRDNASDVSVRITTRIRPDRNISDLGKGPSARAPSKRGSL